jgi:hypothetical protein
MTYTDTFQCPCNVLTVTYEWEAQDPDTGKPMGELINIVVDRNIDYKMNEDTGYNEGTARPFCPRCTEELKKVKELAKDLS